MLSNVITNAWGNGSLNSLFFQGTNSQVNMEVSKWISQYRVEQHETLSKQVGDQEDRKTVLKYNISHNELHFDGIRR